MRVEKIHLELTPDQRREWRCELGDHLTVGTGANAFDAIVVSPEGGAIPARTPAKPINLESLNTAVRRHWARTRRFV